MSNKFLFPSTGKAFLNAGENGKGAAPCRQVSIPFKREGVSELTSSTANTWHRQFLFLFPSNGKAFLNDIRTDLVETNDIVSIPFKREGVSEQATTSELLKYVKFLFPSNGKAFLNSYAFEPLCARVSKAQIQTRFKSGVFFGRRFCENTQEPVSSLRY